MVLTIGTGHNRNRRTTGTGRPTDRLYSTACYSCLVAVFMLEGGVGDTHNVGVVSLYSVGAVSLYSVRVVSLYSVRVVSLYSNRCAFWAGPGRAGPAGPGRCCYPQVLL